MLALAGRGTPLLGSPSQKETYSLSWLALSLEAHFDPDASLDEVIEFRVEGETVHAIVKDGTITTRPGHAADPSITLEPSRDVFLAWGTAHISAKEATASGLKVLGTNRPLTRLARMFSLAA